MFGVALHCAYAENPERVTHGTWVFSLLSYNYLTLGSQSPSFSAGTELDSVPVLNGPRDLRTDWAFSKQIRGQGLRAEPQRAE